MNPRRRAMTLFELTIVVLVMGLLAAVTAPMFADSLRVAKLETAARRLAAHVNYIRSVAINEGRTTTLVCNTQDHSYSCANVDFPDRFGVPINVSLPQEYDPTITLEANFDSSTSLSFDLEGTPRIGSNPMSNGQLVIRSGDESYIVTIAAGTGETNLYRNIVDGDGDQGVSQSPVGQSPSNPGQSPANPGQSPANPGQSPANPGQSPAKPSQSPSNPGQSQSSGGGPR